MRRAIRISGQNVQVLKVPWYSQDDVEWTCFVCSLKMCLEYFKNVYENKVIREYTPNFTIEELMKLTNTRRYTGTALDRMMVKRFREIMPFKTELRTDSSLADVDRKIQKGLPVIVIYDAAFFKVQERGPGHAGVVVGLTSNRDVILNNPWYGAEVTFDRIDFERSWELEYNKAVFFTPIPQTRLDDWRRETSA